EQPDPAELQLGIVAQPLVMVSRHVNDFRALARLAKHLLDDVVMRLRPVPGAPEPPAIDDVPDEVEILGLGMAEEIEQELRFAPARAEMDVRDPDGAEL